MYLYNIYLNFTPAYVPSYLRLLSIIWSRTCTRGYISVLCYLSIAILSSTTKVLQNVGPVRATSYQRWRDYTSTTLQRCSTSGTASELQSKFRLIGSTVPGTSDTTTNSVHHKHGSTADSSSVATADHLCQSFPSDAARKMLLFVLSAMHLLRLLFHRCDRYSWSYCRICWWIIILCWRWKCIVIVKVLSVKWNDRSLINDRLHYCQIVV